MFIYIFGNSFEVCDVLRYSVKARLSLPCNSAAGDRILGLFHVSVLIVRSRYETATWRGKFEVEGDCVPEEKFSDG